MKPGAWRVDILSVAGLLLAIALAILALRRIRTLPGASAAKTLIVLLVAAAVPLIGFAWWGQYTVAGHRAFDEMDALYPFSAGVLGVLLTIGAALAAWRAGRRIRSKL